MKRVLWIGLLASLLLPAQARAQSAFDGTWKIDVNQTQLPTKPGVYVLMNGAYHCRTCIPPIDVRADGLDHRVAGDSCYDTVNIRVLDDRTVQETDKSKGRTVHTEKITVAPDGNTAVWEFADSCDANGEEVTWKQISVRVAKGPAGSHPISGSWRAMRIVNSSENGLSATMKLEGDNFSFADSTGQSYTARLDGPDAPLAGGVSNTVVSVRRVDDGAIEETDKRAGKVVSVTRFTVSADGKTLNVSINDKLQGSSIQFVAQKQ
ncbi:MAG TPA: hypothetical protein VN881_03320 [Candidatus Acidoferrales bacterium]|nr:hypothetical protein [Candidatus Acidoferrales bacterium]